MTESQLLLLAGLIWIAPHAAKSYGLVVGTLMLIISSGRQLGWL